MTNPVEGGAILVVEDDRDICELIVEILEGVGYPVFGVANGQEALAHLQGGAALPVLILLDVMMPLMNGIQFRAEQKKNPAWSHVPVVVMTATNQEQMLAREGGMELEGVPYLRKPIALGTLLDLVGQYAAVAG